MIRSILRRLLGVEEALARWRSRQPLVLSWVVTWVSHALLSTLAIALITGLGWVVTGATSWWFPAYCATSWYYTGRELDQWFHEGARTMGWPDRLGDAAAPWLLNGLLWGVLLR